MFQGLLHWIRKRSITIVNSIAFYPALIAAGFLLISILLLEVDLSSEGQELKLQAPWIRLKDADTARSIVSTITAGVISLTVFSFSMVMIVLNQAASYMSNRILQNLIGNRTQQLILGTYIGTIVYALFLLSSIRDIDSGTSIPALSIFFLILLTVIDIFIFIYFLHYITQSIKYQTIIHRIEKETYQALKEEDSENANIGKPVHDYKATEVLSPQSGYYQGYDSELLLKQADELNLFIEINTPKGTFLLEGTPFIIVYSNDQLTRQDINSLLKNIDFYEGQPIDSNPFYGFKQLVEVAVKALSPGINDPSTAVLSLQALAKLLAYRLQCPAIELFKSKSGHIRLFQKDYSFDELFYHCLRPIWRYGKDDQFIQDAFYDLLIQLKHLTVEVDKLDVVNRLLHQVNEARNRSPLL